MTKLTTKQQEIIEFFKQETLRNLAKTNPIKEGYRINWCNKDEENSQIHRGCIYTRNRKDYDKCVEELNNQYPDKKHWIEWGQENIMYGIAGNAKTLNKFFKVTTWVDYSLDPLNPNATRSFVSNHVDNGLVIPIENSDMMECVAEAESIMDREMIEPDVSLNKLANRIFAQKSLIALGVMAAKE